MSDAMDIDNVPLPLVIHFNPRKLSDLAMVSFVSDLLRYKTIHMDPIRANEINIDDDIADLISDVSLPPDLEAKFKELPNKMIDCRTQWWNYHNYFTFSQRLPVPSMMPGLLDQLVWLHDGSINYRQTAKKLLKYDKLTNLQMYQLACEHCFVEDVKFLKETLTNEELDVASGGFRSYDDPILNYWCKKLHVKETFSNQNIFSFLIEQIIESMRYCYYDPWSATEYFFNRISDDSRLSCANSLVNVFKPRLTWLLPVLTGQELELLIRGNSSRIMASLIEESQYFEYTVLIWKRMVNLVENTDLTRTMHRVNDINSLERSYVNNLLWEMWQALSDSQKKHIVDRKRSRDFTEKVLKTTHRFMNYNSVIFPMILDLLSRVDPKRRLQYWNAHWPALVIGHTSHLEKINRIMKLCFENNRAIGDSKKLIKINYQMIAEHCECLISSGRIKEIQNSLEVCTSDPKLICDMKKKIIRGMSKKDLFTYLFNFSQHSSMADFDRYLEEIQFTKKESESFVFEIISYSSNLRIMSSMFDTNLQDVIKFVEKFVTGEDNLARLKFIFFQGSHHKATSSTEVLLDLTAWCFNGDRNILEKFNKNFRRWEGDYVFCSCGK